jgi:hypothetical protein
MYVYYYQVLKSRTIDAFFDIGERIQIIRRKIRDTERAEGIAPEPNKLPAPGARAELGAADTSAESGAATSAISSEYGAPALKTSSGGAKASDASKSSASSAAVDNEVVPPLTLEEVQILTVPYVPHVYFNDS